MRQKLISSLDLNLILYYGLKIKASSGNEFAFEVIEKLNLQDAKEMVAKVIFIARNESRLKLGGFLRSDNFCQNIVKHFLFRYCHEFRRKMLVDFVKNVANVPQLFPETKKSVGVESIGKQQKVGKEHKQQQQQQQQQQQEMEQMQNKFLLCSLCDNLLNSIQRFCLQNGVPQELKFLFSLLKKRREFGAVLFLRYICPATANPESFGIVKKVSSEVHSKNLILITRIIQRIVNEATVAEEDKSLPVEYINSCISSKILNNIYSIFKDRVAIESSTVLTRTTYFV